MTASGLSRALRIAGAAAALAGGIACSAFTSAPKKPAAGPAPAEPASAAAGQAETPLPAAPPAPPAPPALRVGLESDLGRFDLPPRGTPWTLTFAGQSIVRRGPLSLRPQAAPKGVTRIQVGAFSEESSAREVAARDSERFHMPASVVFSAEKGLYLVRLGEFADASAASAALATVAAAGVEAFAVAEPGRGAGMLLRDESGAESPVAASQIDISPPDAATSVEDRGKKYRGTLRVLVNPRGLLNVVNVVNLEDYLRGVIPAEMGPRRFDELEALKAQAVAARTYALDQRGGFEAEGYDLCATPKCQVYGGIEVEDPLSDAAVEATRGLVAQYQGRLIHALFTSTCGGRTEDVGLIFTTMSGDYLKGVDCGEAQASVLIGAPRGRKAGRESFTGLEWRGEVLMRKASAGRKPATRAAMWRKALELAGLKPAPAADSASPEEVYPAVLKAFALGPTRDVHVTAFDRSYDAGPPDAVGRVGASAREAYETLLRMNFGGEAGLPPPERRMSERELGGLLFSAALRLGGVTEISGRFVRREGGALTVKTAEGRVTLAADTSMLLARRVGNAFIPTAELALRAGDRVRFWKKNGEALAFWAEYEPAGASFDKESSWEEWVRRVSGKELMLRARGRVAGAEVRSVEVTRRGRSGRAVQARITTDQAAVTLSGFELRQALGLPDLLFTVVRAAAPDGSPDFVFLGRGWGHGVGLCQNGAYGMALAGSRFDEILKHYYTGIEIVSFPM